MSHIWQDQQPKFSRPVWAVMRNLATLLLVGVLLGYFIGAASVFLEGK